MSRFARFALLFVVVVMFSLLSVGCSQSGTVEGVVDYKAVYGIMEKSYYAIVVAGSPDGVPHIVVYDQELKGYFPSEGELVISDSLEKQIEAHYSGLDYIISVRALSDGKPSQYLSGFYTNLQVFNQAKVGTAIRFEYSASKMGPEMIRVVE